MTCRRCAVWTIVEPEEVDWLWYPRIPLNHITGLEGDPGEGKSFLTQAMATALSLGQGLPGTDPAEPCNTLLLTAEDHLATTVRPRLQAMDADMSRIYAFDDALSFDESGLQGLEQLIQSTSAQLVVIDPVQAFLPADLDMNRANEVRAVLKSLADIAERHNCAVLIVRHLAKGTTSKAIYRGLGSIDFTAACRSVLLAGSDPDDKSSRALVPIKCNLGPEADPVGYSIEQGQFKWTGETTLTKGQILSAEVDNSSLSEAKEFLQEELRVGRKASKELKREATAAGISNSTLERAKQNLKIKSEKDKFAGKWYWKWP